MSFDSQLARRDYISVRNPNSNFELIFPSITLNNDQNQTHGDAGDLVGGLDPDLHGDLDLVLLDLEGRVSQAEGDGIVYAIKYILLMKINGWFVLIRHEKGVSFLMSLAHH